MTVVVDSCVLIDYLRGVPVAGRFLDDQRLGGALHASEISRLELLAGMRSDEESATRSLLATLSWIPVNEAVSERAGELGRRWLRRNQGIDAADLAIAATAQLLSAELLTTNVKHFPMFEGLTAPY